VLGLGIASGGDWLRQMIYAQSIGLCIWAFIDFGRLLLRRDPDSHLPTGWRGVLLQLSGVTLGFLVGTWIAGRFYGDPGFVSWTSVSRSLGGYYVMAIGISIGISYFFISRGREERRRQQLAIAQRNAAEAKLKLLESQLEPHMLFNTLANLRVLIGVDPARAQATARPAHRLPARDARCLARHGASAVGRVRTGGRLPRTDEGAHG